MNKFHSLTLIGMALGAAALAFGIAAPAKAQAPKRGGELRIGVKGSPDTLDCDAIGGYGFMQTVAPAYSTLLRFDPENYPKIVGDLAESWTISADRLTYTFKLRPGVKFHDGLPFTSADVKASIDRVRNPPQGVISLRASLFAPIASVETPDPATAVVKLSQTSPIMELNFANPFTCMYSAKKLAEDPKYPQKTPFGTGPYKFVEHLPGSFISYTRFDQYMFAPQPYLDSIKFYFMNDDARTKAIQSGQVDGSVNSIATAQKDAIGATRSDMVFPEAPYNATNQITINTARAPFTDVRVRKAMNLALDRQVGDALMSKVWSGKGYGILFPGGANLDMTDAEIAKVPGFGPDVAAARAEAKRLLADAGQSNLHATLLNRNSGEPYSSLGVYMLDQWRQIGAMVDQHPIDPAPYDAALSGGNFDLAIDSNVTVSPDPSEVLVKYLPGSNLNWGNVKDPVLVDLFDRQAAATDPVERKRLVTAFQMRVVDQAYVIPGFRSLNRGALPSFVKGWTIMPSPTMNVDFRQVWLDK